MACDYIRWAAQGDILAGDDESYEEYDDVEPDDEDESRLDQQLVGMPLVHWCTQDFLYHYVYLAEKAYVASHFVLDIFWTCDLSIYIYIFYACGCTFMVLYASIFMMV